MRRALLRAAPRGVDGLDLEVHPALHAFGPNLERADALQDLGREAVLAVLRTRGDDLPGRVVPEVAELVERNANDREILAHRKIKVGLVSVREAFAFGGMRRPHSEPPARIRLGRTDFEREAVASRDVRERRRAAGRL